MKITLFPKNHKLLKNKKIHVWLRRIEKQIENKMKNEEWERKIAESVMCGVPLFLYNDGRMEVCYDYYAVEKHNKARLKRG